MPTAGEASQADDVPSCLEDVGVLSGPMPDGSDQIANLVKAVEHDRFIPLTEQMLYGQGSERTPEQVIRKLTCGNPEDAYGADPDLEMFLNGFQAHGSKHSCIDTRVLSLTTDKTRRVAK
ncbi:hypothetical protein N0V90_001644 [Kalmusia sp. IMI 367209]|nr:hypothetical protein N0V90_001644 [Kalmusia sp. IMI 367209]